MNGIITATIIVALALLGTIGIIYWIDYTHVNQTHPIVAWGVIIFPFWLALAIVTRVVHK